MVLIYSTYTPETSVCSAPEGKVLWDVQSKTLMDKILAMSYCQENLLNGLMMEIFVCMQFGSKKKEEK